MAAYFYVEKVQTGPSSSTFQRAASASVVDVAADDEAFVGLLPAERENTRIRGALREAVFKEPGKKRSLPASARLGHTINGLFHAAYARTAVCAQGSVPWGCVAIDHLARLQLPLQ
eukprot:6183615-Pleurochrysis_carterae.AAC.2